MTSATIGIICWLAQCGFVAPPPPDQTPTLRDRVTPVPEGSTAVLLASGAIFLLAPQILRQVSARRRA